MKHLDARVNARWETTSAYDERTGAPGWNWHISRVSSVNSFLHCWRVHTGIVVVGSQVRNSGNFHTIRRTRFLATARLIFLRSSMHYNHTRKIYYFTEPDAFRSPQNFTSVKPPFACSCLLYALEVLAAAIRTNGRADAGPSTRSGVVGKRGIGNDAKYTPMLSLHALRLATTGHGNASN